jgi:hypothetical protein
MQPGDGIGTIEDMQQHYRQRQQQQLAENLAIQVQNNSTDGSTNFPHYSELCYAPGRSSSPVNGAGQLHQQLMHTYHIDYQRAQIGIGGMHVSEDVTALCFSIQLCSAKQQFDESVFTIHAIVRTT